MFLPVIVHKGNKEFWQDVQVCNTCDFVYFWEVCQESHAGTKRIL